jgi:hypothetical protein
MSAGDLADKALTLINQASGELGRMVVKKRINRNDMIVVIYKLEEALKDLKEILR